jgi:Transposase and inactivated derivatives
MYAPYVSLVKKLFPNAQLIIDRFHIVQHIGRTFLNHRVKETTVRLKGNSHSQRGLGKKLKRYWKLLQKEEAKLNYEKRVWRASFKDYLTESEIADRLLAACPNLRQGYQLYQDILYAVKKRDQSLFEDCLTRDISGLPETYTTTLRTFKSSATDPKCASLQLFKRTIGMLKQPHQSIKTQCVRLSQLLQFQTTNYDSSWQNIFNQINRTERGFLLSVLSKLF